LKIKKDLQRKKKSHHGQKQPLEMS